MKNLHFNSCYRQLFPLIAVVFLLSVWNSFAAPENTVIVVNSDSWASTRIANEYIYARGIPSCNVIYLNNIPSFDRMEVEDFRKKILFPVLQALNERGLSEQTDAILYSADFPTEIDFSADAGSVELTSKQSPHASINSLTYHWQHVFNRSIGYLNPDNANLYGRRMQSPSSLDIMDQSRKNVSGSADALSALKKYQAMDSALHLEIARLLALLDRPDEAVASLKGSAEKGWFDAYVVERHEDFKSLRSRPDFNDLMTLMKGRKIELLPTMGLRGADFFGEDGGKITMDPSGQGIRYMISTVLAVTSGRGNSAEEAIASLKRSVAADGTHPVGTVYFMKNDDVRSWTREWGFQRAVEKLAEEGVKGEILSGVLPQGKPDVAGVCVGSKKFDWTDSGSTILPGAICEHFTSKGGRMAWDSDQTPLTEFIRHGAAGASGTVVEPFSEQPKFPSPFIQYFYAQGCSLGEAFYQSLLMPYQLLIVGDALCRPWGRRIEVSVKGIDPSSTISGVARITPSAKSPDGIETGSFELYSDTLKLLMKVKPGESFDLDTKELSDGPQKLSVIARGTDPLGTQGRLVLNVNVRNRKEELVVIAPKRREYAWDERIEIKVSLPGAVSLNLLQNNRNIWEVQADKGTATINAYDLGQGPVRLIPVARIGDGKKIIGNTLGQPIDFTINPPKALPPIEIPAGQQLADGFQVQLDGKTPVISTRSEGDWLSQAGIAKENNFTVDAWFSVPETAVYQFQLKGDVAIDFKVDYKPQVWPAGEEWLFIPVHLEKGLHHLCLKARSLSSKPFEIRFGGKGTRCMDGANFRHLKPIPANP